MTTQKSTIEKESFLNKYFGEIILTGAILLIVGVIALMFLPYQLSDVPDFLKPTNYADTFYGEIKTGTEPDFHYENDERVAPFEKDVFDTWTYGVTFTPISAELPQLSGNQTYAVAVKLKERESGLTILHAFVWNDATQDLRTLIPEKFEILGYQAYVVSQTNGQSNPYYNPVADDARTILTFWCEQYENPDHNLYCTMSN